MLYRIGSAPLTELSEPDAENLQNAAEIAQTLSECGLYVCLVPAKAPSGGSEAEPDPFGPPLGTLWWG